MTGIGSNIALASWPRIRSCVRPAGLSLLLVLVLSSTASARQNPELISPRLLEAPWDAWWIVHPEAPGREVGVFHFRRAFLLDTLPESYVIHVSGDSRYRLFVNGRPLSKGPAVGDRHNWRFETLDIAESLRRGQNVLAATVWNFGEHSAISHHSYRTALVVQGNGEREAAVNTGPGWRAYQNGGYEAIPVSYQDVDGYFAAPPGESMRADRYPWGWKGPGFDDSGWAEALPYLQATPKGTNPFGNLYGWSLVPRTIPMMEETRERIPRVRRAEGVEPRDGFLDGSAPLEIPAGARASLLLDRGHITNAYPVLIVSGGADARIKLTYAEALRDEENRKGHRDEIDGKRILGYHDLFFPDGGERRELRTLWLRSFRYVELEIETANDPLVVHDLHGIFTGYPFREHARFESSDPRLRDIWRAAWRTARLNAFESYWDCAYYEQLQYVGDTRIQALISLYISGDERLMRNALLHFNDSRSPDGLTMSRYPSRHPQYIPPYSLLWIAMIHDYWMHRSDPELVARLLPGVRGVIDWYEHRLDPSTGLPGATPWWNYVDAAAGFERGTPPGADEGGSVVIALQLRYVLAYAAELAEAFDRPHDAARYRLLWDRLGAAILEHGWSEEKQMMADTPERDRFSQHSNILAVLAGVVPGGRSRELLERILRDEALVRATYYFRFYLFRAMWEAGMAGHYLDQLDPWHEALELGLTTFPEHPEPSRSDAHAWSSSPLYDFFATVAGVRPDSPGFESVLIRPHPGPLEWFDASMPHPLGEIRVRIDRRGDAPVAEITLPEGLAGRFVWEGRETPVQSGSQTMELPGPGSP